MTLEWDITYSIPLDITGFEDSWPNLNSSKAIDVTAEELVWSAMMVGYPGQVLDFWALLHRASIVLGYLSAPATRSMMANPIEQSSDFERADLTEKGAVSYYLGLFAAKAISARLLDIPWLVHYDFYLRSRGYKATGTRPDLVGVSHRGPAPGTWFAVEAKGRSADVKGKALAGEFAKAKYQLGQALVPEPRGAGIASIATFRSKEWRVAWQDPEPASDDPLSAAEHSRFLAAYYEPVLRSSAR